MNVPDLDSFIGDDEPPTIPEIHNMIQNTPEEGIEYLNLLIDTLPDVPDEHTVDAAKTLNIVAANDPDLLMGDYHKIAEWVASHPEETLLTNVSVMHPLLRAITNLTPHVDADDLHEHTETYLKVFKESSNPEISEWTLPILAKITAAYPDNFGDEETIEALVSTLKTGSRKGRIEAIACLNEIAHDHPNKVGAHRHAVENIWTWDSSVTVEWVSLLRTLTLPPVKSTPPKQTVITFVQILMKNSTPLPIRVEVIETIGTLLETYPKSSALYDANMAQFLFNELTHGDDRVRAAAAEHTVHILLDDTDALNGVTYPELDTHLENALTSDEIDINTEDDSTEEVIDVSLDAAKKISV